MPKLTINLEVLNNKNTDLKFCLRLSNSNEFIDFERNSENHYFTHVHLSVNEHVKYEVIRNDTKTAVKKGATNISNFAKSITITIDCEEKKNTFTLDFISDPSNYYQSNLQDERLKLANISSIKKDNLVLYRIDELTFEKEYPRKEAFENVLSSMRLDDIYFLYLIIGNGCEVKFYLGVVQDMINKNHELALSDIGEDILQPNILGNFRGSKVQRVKAKETSKILNTLRGFKDTGILEGVPGLNEDNEEVQGVDRLVDVMASDKFALAIISAAINEEEIATIEKKLIRAYNSIAPFAKKSVQEGENKSSSKGFNKGNSKSEGRSETRSESQNESNSSSNTEGSGKNRSTSKGSSEGTNSSGKTNSTNKNGSEGSSSSKSKTTGISRSVGINDGKTKSYNESNSETIVENNSHGTSNATTLEFLRKEAQDWLSFLDEVIFPRLDYGKGKGLFISNAYLFAEHKSKLLKLSNTMRSLYSGQKGNKVPLKMNDIDKNSDLKSFVDNLQIPSGKMSSIPANEEYARTTLSQYINDDISFIGNWISSKELSLIAGLPKKEVIGLTLKEEVEFGLNYDRFEEKERIEMGKLVQSGSTMNQKVFLDKAVLDKHIFIAGVTGSGKTTTCKTILSNSNIPFLVIEPAKTEYRDMLVDDDDLLVFTLGQNSVAPFKLNPFEFFPHENISSRVDMIKASLEASFDMEAAIPQIIEAALYECYEDLGWNIATNKNNNFDDPFADGVYAFPILSDLIKKITVVVEKQGFDTRLKNDYIGSIKARLQSLLVGSKGLMLNTKRSINFEYILEHKIVLELEEIKNGNEKSLIMGFILTNLIEALKAKYKRDRNFKHITLVEEAHRLLCKYSPGDSMNKKQGVEVFTDMLAEVRKYGESLIIVDQIPNKLTPEVLKNTNTKIVHKIFAQDDKESIGNTIVLDDDQKSFLSNLAVGRAIVFTQGWNKPIQVQMNFTQSKSKMQVTEDLIRDRALQFYCKTYKSGVLIGLQYSDKKPSIDDVKKYLYFLDNNDELICNYKKVISNNRAEDIEKMVKSYEAARKHFSKNIIIGFLSNKLYGNNDILIPDRIKLIKKFISYKFNVRAEFSLGEELEIKGI
jgi:hypothetical protein